ncbi:MAG TPA: methyltransferase domain-containing protein [Gemmataceae bacterium]|nr:methyltransferase domain-containing protein [Gemmataceae bacterium]
MLIGGELGYRVLQHFPTPRSWQIRLSSVSAPTPGKLESYWGHDIWEELAGRTVIDFGCGTGADTIEIARHGAERVIGLDIVAEALAVAERAAERANVADRCCFQTTTTEKADAILCLDSFEHFSDPAGILRTMAGLLKPGGTVLVSFGPPWLHPYGGHSFSAFPWAHLIFTEKSLLRWRSHHCGDGATRFGEVRGGLNQMTIRRFERLVADSPLQIRDFEAIPIRPVRLLHNRLTREFFTSMVRCKLRLNS